MKLSTCFFALCVVVCVTQITTNASLSVKSGDIQIKKIRSGSRLYKSRPLYTRQQKMTKYMQLRSRIPDWAGQYFAFSEPVARSYGSDYLTNEKGGFYLKTYEFKRDFEVLLIKNKKFADGSIRQELKADELKKFFKSNGLGNLSDNRNIPEYQYTKISEDLKRYFANTNVPVISILNNLDLALECPHDNSNNELILPPNFQWSNVLREVNSKVLVYGLRSAAPGTYETFNDLNSVVEPYKKIVDDQKKIIDSEREDSLIIIED